MVDRDRLDAFRKRFGLGSDTEALKRFRVRIVHAAKESLSLLRDNDRDAFEKEFAFRNGSELLLGDSWGGGLNIVHGIVDELEHAESFPELVERIQNLLWTFEAFGYFEDRTRRSDREKAGSTFATTLQQAIDLSPGVDLRLQVSPGQVELAPAGVPLLDDVVDSATQWLARYPDVRKEFRQSLTILAEKKRAQYRQAQDSLRFALEKLLKLLLNNTNRLEDQGRPLKDWLSSKGVHDRLRDVSVQIMTLVTKQYQNAAVKHDNDPAGGAAKSWSDFEVEYMVYQYATLLRLLMESESN